MEEEFETKKRKWYHMDVEHTPCARSALMHGIGGGLLVGALYFMKSNVVRRSCDFAVGGFALVSLISWGVCRTAKATERANIKYTVKILNEATEKRRKERNQNSTTEASTSSSSSSSPSDS